MKDATEYALEILDLTTGNRLEAVKILFEAEAKFPMSKDYVTDVFNVLISVRY